MSMPPAYCMGIAYNMGIAYMGSIYPTTQIIVDNHAWIKNKIETERARKGGKEEEERLHHLGLKTVLFNQQSRSNRIIITLCKNFSQNLCWKLGVAFCSTQLLNTSPNPCLQKLLQCKFPCHSWKLGLGTPCEVAGKSQIHVLNGQDCSNWRPMIWVLGLGTPCEVVSLLHSCFQRLILLILTSNVLGLRTRDPNVWSGKSLHSCSQRLRLLRLTSSELGLRT